MKKLVYYIIAFFALIYASISLVNHYLFRTHALDLGVFNHALYTFSNFRWETSALTLIDRQINYFGDHFSLTTLLYTPLIFLFGTYTCLIVQIIAILLGGLGVYKYASLLSNYKFLPLIILVHFYSIWGIYSALAFDFHENVVAAMIVPWILYFYEKRTNSLFIIAYLLLLFTKENMAFWGIFIILGILVKDYKFNKSKQLPLLSFLLVFSSIYFVVIVNYYMPYLNGIEENLQLFRYAHLGNGIGEILLNALRNPIQTFTLFFADFENTISDSKLEFYLLLLFSGGFAIFLVPEYLLMIIPIITLKMLSSDNGFWGINYQYSIEFVPILSLALFTFCNRLKNYKTVMLISLTTLIATITLTIVTLEHRKSTWYSAVKHRFYSKDHYVSDYTIKKVYDALSKIPDDASLSKSSRLSPHLAFRDSLYHFPFIRNAEFIALLKHGDAYPLSNEAFEQSIKELKTSKVYIIFEESSELIIFKRLN